MYFLDPHGLAVRNLAISKAIFNGAEDSAGESDGNVRSSPDIKMLEEEVIEWQPVKWHSQQ